MTASVLTVVGLPELVADTPDAYVRAAAGLIEDPARPATLRADLRGRVAVSPLCDGAAFTRGLEGADRAMWRRWCVRPR